MDSAPVSVPVPVPVPVVSVEPLVLAVPGRGEELRVRVSAPVTGRGLPVVVFAHGFGASLEGYGPLADYWAARGFAVVQPTHLDAKSVGLAADDPRRPGLWRYRVEDVRRVLDQLDVLVGRVPGLAGRVDQERIAVAGHSFGGQTAGVLLATAGRGGDALTPFATENLPWLRGPEFAHLKAPALVVAGDRDASPLTVRGPEWMADPYVLSPGEKSLLTLFGAEHFLGGISGYEVAETTDENPARVALVQEVTLAYLRHVLGVGSEGWERVRRALGEEPHPLGRLVSKAG
ncbi:alpha/beta hydrolase family protein [Streptomyces albidoflavus]